MTLINPLHVRDEKDYVEIMDKEEMAKPYPHINPLDEWDPPWADPRNVCFYCGAKILNPDRRPHCDSQKRGVTFRQLVPRGTKHYILRKRDRYYLRDVVDAGGHGKYPCWVAHWAAAKQFDRWAHAQIYAEQAREHEDFKYEVESFIPENVGTYIPGKLVVTRVDDDGNIVEVPLDTSFVETEATILTFEPTKPLQEQGDKKPSGGHRDEQKDTEPNQE